MPIEICLEDVHQGSDAPKYVRCVAIDGGRRGLGFDALGRVTWLADAAACEVFVAADGRLAMTREEGAPRVVVGRAGRRVDVPQGKPVFLLGGDDLWVGERHVRVYVHGAVAEAAPPEPLWDRVVDGLRRRAATVGFLGALGVGALAEAGCRTPADAMQASADPVTTPDASPACSPDGPCNGPAAASPDAASADVVPGAEDTGPSIDTGTPPIEIRPLPPKPAIRPDPTPRPH